MKYYTGIGSRETPADICRLMTQVAIYLQIQGYTLRSGGAQGADAAFERGARGAKEIWLPWPSFNSNLSRLFPSKEAHDLASTLHPKWNILTPGAKKLHARNMHQILGIDLDTPSEFVVCWTKDGEASGGTGQALRLAIQRQIPIFNLKKDKEEFSKFLREKFRKRVDKENETV